MTVIEEGMLPLVPLSELEALLDELTSASTQLSTASRVPEQVRALLRTLPERLRADSPGRALPGDPYLNEQVYAGASRAVAALLLEEEAEQRRVARLAVEQVRQGLRDMLEARGTGDDVPVAELTTWLEGVLGDSPTRLARLAGTTPGTWQRWTTGRQQPDEVSALRLRRAAQLVGHLQHTLTAPGVMRWFDRPHPAIKDGAGTPLDLLDDAEGYRLLISLASGLRSMQAS